MRTSSRDYAGVRLYLQTTDFIYVPDPNLKEPVLRLFSPRGSRRAEARAGVETKFQPQSIISCYANKGPLTSHACLSLFSPSEVDNSQRQSLFRVRGLDSYVDDSETAVPMGNHSRGFLKGGGSTSLNTFDFPSTFPFSPKANDGKIK